MSSGHLGRWPKKQQALKSMDRPSLECDHFLSFIFTFTDFLRMQSLSLLSFHIKFSWWVSLFNCFDQNVWDPPSIQFCSIRFPLIVYWICLHRMFETHPPWRDLWQHMGSRLPIEDQMVLPRWLHSSIHFLIYLVVVVDVVLFRFVRHTVTNLTYLDKVLVSLLDCYLGFLILSNPQKMSHHQIITWIFTDSVKPNQNISKYLTWQGDWGGGRSEEDDCKRSMAYQVWKSLSKY